MLGIPGDNTYSNYQEAHRALWRNTVLPLVTRTAKALSAWLSPAYGTDLALRADLDGIEALSSEREALWARIERASFLTIDEKRAATGYGPMPGDNLGAGEGASNAPENFTPSATENAGPVVLQKYRPNQARAPRGSADGGQWVDEGGGGSGSSGNSSSFRAAIRSEFGSDTQGETDASPERVRVAQASEPPPRYTANLAEDEKQGGHTIARHVAKTDLEMSLRLEKRTRRTPLGTIYAGGESAFHSIESANDFTNRVLEDNRTLVDQVAAGARSDASMTKRFGYETGRQLVRVKDDPEKTYIRKTYAVFVHIVHEKDSPRGYIVKTAYPKNEIEDVK